MTQLDFLNITRDAYLEARLIKFPPKKFPELLRRGTSHSISSITEDLFGYYCTDKIIDPRNLKVLIDPQISFVESGLMNKSGKRSLLIRPDVAIVRNDCANCFFDIKTDLGYKRNELLGYALERSQQMGVIKGKNAFYKDGQTKIANPLKISGDIKFFYIVISSGNISTEKRNSIITDINQLKDMGIFLLSIGEHLNLYQDKISYELNKTDFDKLDELLQKLLG